MKLFVGLGNPGAKYAHNRHNIGFMALDRLAEDHQFSPWRSKFQGQICGGILGGHKVLLLKPATFMNLSGQSVGEAARFHKIPLDQITVFHDELDLATGKLRFKQGGAMRGIMGCALSTLTWAQTMAACVWELAILAIRMRWPALCCETLPRQIKIGWQPCSRALAMAPCIWPRGMAQSS